MARCFLFLLLIATLFGTPHSSRTTQETLECVCENVRSCNTNTLSRNVPDQPTARDRGARGGAKGARGAASSEFGERLGDELVPFGGSFKFGPVVVHYVGCEAVRQIEGVLISFKFPVHQKEFHDRIGSAQLL